LKTQVKELSSDPDQNNLLSQNHKNLGARLHTAARRGRVGPQHPPDAIPVPSEAAKVSLPQQVADRQRKNEERKLETPSAAQAGFACAGLDPNAAEVTN
jgi:hypothetical protein